MHFAAKLSSQVNDTTPKPYLEHLFSAVILCQFRTNKKSQFDMF